MKRIFFLIFLSISFNSFSQINNGDWYGELNIMGKLSPIGISIEDKKVFIPPVKTKFNKIDSVFFDETSLVFYSSEIRLKYTGQIKGDSIIGFWEQSAMSFPLILTRKKIEKPKRPQTPVPPFNYYTEELVIENAEADLSLSGTLTLPAKDDKQYPVVVLVSGSGPQDRDSDLYEGHKWFAVIADHLAKQGIGSFRYDERGIGKSTGKYRGSDLNDFQNDVDVIVNQLLERKEISKLGLLGHSEGGIIAPRYASENKKKIDFVIMIGAPGVATNEVMHNQRRNFNELAGTTEDFILANEKMFRKVDEAVLNAISEKEKVNQIKEIVKQDMKVTGATEDAIQSATRQIIAFVNRPWYNSFIIVEPNDYLTKVKCPVLAMGGGKDLQVDAKMNLTGISKSLNSKIFCRVDNSIMTFGSLNHLMQPAKTGGLDEYTISEITIDRQVLFAISEWIKELK